MAKELLGVTGFVNNKKLLFMIDSGASSNFLSSSVVETLGLNVVCGQF